MVCSIGIREVRTITCDEPGCGFEDNTALTQRQAEDIADDHEAGHAGIYHEGEDA